MRRTYRYVDGVLTDVTEQVRPRSAGVTILGDIEPFQSPIDGSTITSRSRMREHMARHNVTHVSDYKEYWKNAAKERAAAFTPESRHDRESRIESIKHAIEAHR